ncbi:hypothetical protein GH733_002897 [Mirounga leonina]|nr:hypothetical protein GH733_002897 [Mirounga leonina]
MEYDEKSPYRMRFSALCKRKLKPSSCQVEPEGKDQLAMFLLLWLSAKMTMLDPAKVALTNKVRFGGREFLAKEHIHQRISSQAGKKVLILLMSGKAHKGEHNSQTLWDRQHECEAQLQPQCPPGPKISNSRDSSPMPEICGPEENYASLQMSSAETPHSGTISLLPSSMDLLIQGSPDSSTNLRVKLLPTSVEESMNEMEEVAEKINWPKNSKTVTQNSSATTEYPGFYSSYQDT